MGAALGLIVLDGCSKDAAAAAARRIVLVAARGVDGRERAQQAIGGTEAILDVQTHLLDYAHVPNAPDFTGFPQRNCGDGDPKLCFGIDHWMEELFLRSDTGMVVLSAIPIIGDADPLSIEVMERARAFAAQLCGDGRVLLQGHAVPNVGRLDAALAAMDELHASHPIAAWKVYTHAPGPGWSFTDATGEAFLGRVSIDRRFRRDAHRRGAQGVLGGRAVGVAGRHRAGGDRPSRPALRRVPLGLRGGKRRGTVHAGGGGVDRLVKSLRDAGVRAGGNVFAELGSTWKSVMADPDQAAHVLGKLLVAVGEDNILWGTDSIWYGSPQDQIQAFRAFEITAESQERFGYPALTPAVKAKILGQNAAPAVRHRPGQGRGRGVHVQRRRPRTRPPRDGARQPHVRTGQPGRCCRLVRGRSSVGGLGGEERGQRGLVEPGVG